MSTLRIQVTADGVSRTFEGDGSGPELVACFRAWLASGDLALPLADGADGVDEAAAAVEARATVIEGRSVALRVESAAVRRSPVPLASAAAAGDHLDQIGRRLMEEAFFPGSDAYDIGRLRVCVRGVSKEDVPAALHRLVERRLLVATADGRWRLPA